MPSLEEVDSALALIKKTTVMLNLLIRQIGFDFDNQLIEFEWTDIFRVPWIVGQQ